MESSSGIFLWVFSWMYVILLGKMLHDKIGREEDLSNLSISFIQKFQQHYLFWILCIMCAAWLITIT